MDDMAVDIYKDVVIVSVFNVKQVLDQTVACQALNEVSGWCLPIGPKDLLVYVLETAFVGDLLEVADSSSVIDELDKPTVRTVRNNGIWSYPYFYVFLNKYLVD